MQRFQPIQADHPVKFRQQLQRFALRHAAHKAALAGYRGDPALRFQLPVGPGDGVGVDGQLRGQLPNAGKLLAVFQNADIAVLRSGKAKKSDPPIPTDLAPISGSGKRARRVEDAEEKLLLEPIRFRYSTEKIVEETEEIHEEAAAETSEQKASRSRRRRNGSKEGAKQNAEAPQKQEKPKKEPKEPKQPREPKESPAAAPEAEGEQQAKKQHRRRPNHRRHKPKSGGEAPQA